MCVVRGGDKGMCVEGGGGSSWMVNVCVGSC